MLVGVPMSMNRGVPLAIVEQLEESRCRVYDNGRVVTRLDRLSIKSDALDNQDLPVPEPVTVRLQPCQPQIESIGTHNANIYWDNLAIPSSLPSSCEVTYEVELGQADGAGPNAGDWQPGYTGTSNYCQVSGLRPGRVYRIRVRVRVQLLPTDEDGFRVTCDPSAITTFTTKPTVPSTPAPACLASRDRKALKLKWSVPDEAGGAGPLQYHLYCNPGPTEIGPEARCDAEGYWEVYRGPEKSFKVAKLVPGSRYKFKLKASNRIGDSPVSLCSTFTTQATVPSMPEPPLVLSSSSDSIILQWRAPPDNGSLITSYRLERDNGGGNDFQLVYAGPNTSCVAMGLRSGLRYSFRLLAENDEGKSMWSGCTVATTAAVPPSAPSALTCMGTTQESATLSWRQPEDSGGSRVAVYEVELQAKCRAAMEHMGTDWLRIFEGEAMACTINLLRAGCTYRARVRANSFAGWGSYSVPIDVVTTADVPDAPAPPTLGIAEATFLGVEWKPPAHSGGAKIGRYLLEVAQAAPCACGSCPSGIHQQAPCETALPGNSVQMALPGGMCTAEIRDLQPGTFYFFRVQAGNKQGLGAWSQWARLQTLPDVPLAPSSLHAAATSSNSISLRWHQAEGQGAPVTLYTVEMGQQATGFVQVHRGPACCCEVKGLQPATTYQFRVQAANQVGAGAWSEALQTRTAAAPPEAPLGLQAMAAGSYQVELSWQAPAVHHGSPVTSYVLEGAPAGLASGTKKNTASVWTQVYTGPATRNVVSGLSPGREYMFRVRAANVCGLGPVSDLAYACTLPAPPSAPVKLQCTQRTATQLRVKWEEPAEWNGAPLLTYQLELGSLQEPPSQQQQQQLQGQEQLAEQQQQEQAAPEKEEQQQQQSLSSCTSDGISWRVVYTGKDTAARIPDLHPYTRFLLRVQATNAAGCGPFSEELAAVTSLAPPGPPINLEVLDTGLAASSTDLMASEGAWAALRWEPAVQLPSCAPAVSYEVVANPAAPAAAASSGSAPAAAEAAAAAAMALAGGAVRMTVGKGVTECRLEKLAPGTTYIVRLRSVGAEGAGHSVWSTEATVMTQGQRPAAGAAAGPAATSASGTGAKGGKGSSKKSSAKRSGSSSSVPAAAVAVAAAADSSSRGSEEGPVSTSGGSGLWQHLAPGGGAPPAPAVAAAATQAAAVRRASAAGAAKKVLAAAAPNAVAVRPPKSEMWLMKMWRKEIKWRLLSILPWIFVLWFVYLICTTR